MSSALQGVAELLKQLEAIGQAAADKALRAAVRAGARAVVKEARARIPVGKVAHYTYKRRVVSPGFAKRSIRAVVVLSKDKQKASASIGVRNEAFYATQFVELGTATAPAHPWLRPALESSSDEQVKLMAESLRKSILKAAKKK